jgi:phage terminase large subunit
MQKINPNLAFLRSMIQATRIIALQGGTRSGKTYSALQFLIELCYQHQDAGIIITICRKTFPALRGTVMRDFFEILRNEDMYSEDCHSKSENTYILFGNLIEFISLDDEQKIRGRKRNILYMNEANELDFDTWRQLLFRTENRIVIDFNPSDEFHWIYEHVLTREDCKLLITTYKDNPFLTKDQVREIELLATSDPEYWEVFGLGQRGKGKKGLVYPDHFEIDRFPEGVDYIYGLDFGYTNDPTALVKVAKHNGKIYMEEVIYQKGMSNGDIAAMAKAQGITSRDLIIADSAEPKSIDELCDRGLNVIPAVKGPDSIDAGISFIKAHELYFVKSGGNLLKERRLYKWAVNKAGESTNKPLDFMNHAMDAMRYAIYTNYAIPQETLNYA